MAAVEFQQLAAGSRTYRRYGARPLRRLVQTEVGDQLARMLLAGKVHDGDTVLVDQTGSEHLELTAWASDKLMDDGAGEADGADVR